MNVLGTVLSIFLLMFVGYGAKKVRLLRPEDADLLNTVVIYVTLPAFIFNATYGYRQPLPVSIAKAPIIAFGAMIAVMCLAYLAGRALKLDRPTLGALVLASMFGNTGFLGYPVVQAAFREKGALVAASLYDQFVMAVPLYTMGVLIAAGFGGQKVKTSQLLKVLTLPALWAIPIALLVRPLALPAPLLDAIGYLGAGTIPLVMISLGLSLSARSLKGWFLCAAVACVLKLGIMPLLTHYAISAAGVSGTVYKVTVLEAGMPTSMISAVIAGKYGANGRFVASVIFFSTLLSIITIPAALLILGGP